MCNHKAGRCTQLHERPSRWQRPPGYYREEVKAALRRTIKREKGRRDKWGRYKPLDYSLPLPTLVVSSRRLGDAVLHGDGFYAEGVNAAELFIKWRRKQLGLSNAMIRWGE